MSAGRVLFVGCGPGAADLLTLRAARAIASADVVVWGRSLLDAEAVAEHARSDAEIVAWPPATERDVLAVYERARDEDLLVARLKGGDPAIFGALEPELSAVRELGLAHEIVPGVSAAGAAGAGLGREIALPGAPLLLIGADDLTAHAVRAGAPPGAVAAFMAGRDPAALASALAARGLPADTPCAVAVDVSRPSEILATCRMDELAECVEDVGLGGATLVLAGSAIGGFASMKSP